MTRIYRNLCVGIVSILPITAIAQTATTQPAPTSRVAARGQQRGGEIAGRFREALYQLDLTDEQKSKIKDALTDLQEKFQELRSSGLSQDEMREKGRDLLMNLREQMQTILTPQQQQKLRSIMRGEGGPATRPARTEAPMKEMKEMQDESSSSEKPGQTSASASFAKTTLKPGQAAPEITAKKLDSLPLRLENLKGRILVLVFGSYSTPTFRDKAQQLDQLAASMNVRATFAVVYTKEAHPTGGWEVERNKQQNIEVPQAKKESDRVAQAKLARDSLHLSHVIIATDNMSDATAKAYDLMPNGVAIIGRDGKVIATQKWLEPTALRHIVESAAAPQPTSLPLK